MMKKILSILAIVFLSIIIAPSVFAEVVCDPSTGGACANDSAGADRYCLNSSKTDVPSFSCGYCTPLCSEGKSCQGSGTNYSCKDAVNNLSGPASCIKINSSFTVKLINGSGQRVDTRFTSGLVVAGDNVTKCPLTSDGGLVGTECAYDNSDKTGACYLTQPNQIGIVGMLNVIYSVTNWVFYILTLVAVLMIIYGGFVYITSSGDPAKATTGKSILTFAIIGLAIALLAKFIPSLVRFILGV